MLQKDGREDWAVDRSQYGPSAGVHFAEPGRRADAEYVKRYDDEEDVDEPETVATRRLRFAVRWVCTLFIGGPQLQEDTLGAGEVQSRWITSAHPRLFRAIRKRNRPVHPEDFADRIKKGSAKMEN